MSDCPTRARLCPRVVPSAPVGLGEVAAVLLAGLPVPSEPRQPSPAARVRIEDEPLVRAVLAAFPGAAIVGVRERDQSGMKRPAMMPIRKARTT